MYSHKVLKRFVKDYSLPIQIVQEPYFTYFVELYNEQYKTKEKLNLLDKALENFNSDEEFLAEYYKIRDNIIKTIEATDVYQEYNTMKLDKYTVPNNGYPKHDIFNMGNVNKYFMSIDLKKANFQALKWFNPEIVLNCESYAELLGKFTDLEYMKESKYLRQVIFGNMNPKRQVKLERYITEQILNYLLTTPFFIETDIRMVSNDEIIFEISHEDSLCIMTDKLINDIKNNLNFDVDIETFKLNNIEGSTKFFVKEFKNKNGYELMCIPLVYHSQIYKKYNDLPMEDNDLLFYYENQVCKFINPLKFESEEFDNEYSADER
ncbi:hypothetical protein [Clostridium sp.]|uniref:hypothetical protein n=1 Tax=Clostridium sp. TaxID=1506 RepID=UPI00262163D1|nr:hypothetical protein [Clostridium sp.]